MIFVDVWVDWGRWMGDDRFVESCLLLSHVYHGLLLFIFFLSMQRMLEFIVFVDHVGCVVMEGELSCGGR